MMMSNFKYLRGYLEGEGFDLCGPERRYWYLLVGGHQREEYFSQSEEELSPCCPKMAWDA